MFGRRLSLTTILVVLVSLAVAACAASPAAPSVAPRPPQAQEGGQPASAPAGDAGKGGTSSSGQSAGLPNVGQQNAALDERKIIRTGSLALIVKSPDEAASQIKATVEGLGGYVQSSQISDSGKYRTGNVQVKVPSQNFFSALDQIKRLAEKVRAENTSAQDVTEEYTDVETQLRTLRTQYDAYLEMLKSARTTDDILKIRARLDDLQAQINRLEGRKTFLDRNAAMSTISISLTMAEAAPPVVEGNWDFVAVVTQALRAFVQFTQGIVTVLVWLVVFGWPFVLLFLLVRWIMSRRPQQPRMQQQPPPPPPAQ